MAAEREAVDALVARIMHWVDRYDCGLTGDDLPDRIRTEIERGQCVVVPAGGRGGEREAFEKWYPTVNMNFVQDDLLIDEDGYYRSPFTHCAWLGWTARTAAPAEPTTEKGEGNE